MGNISSNISAFQSLHIVMLGLDSAGKTTVLYRLKFNEFVNTVPTIGFNTEKIKLSNGTAKGISCHFWDVGGQEKLRPLWKSYSRCTDGIIYVVDSVDVDRLEEAKTELHKVTKFAENQGTPLLVIANKQDLPKSLPVAEIEKQLALHELIPATTYHVQPACAIIGEGLTEGMDKLYEMILKRRKSLKQKKKRVDGEQYRGECMFVPGEELEDAQICLHEVHIAVASAGALCRKELGDANGLLVQLQGLTRHTVQPEAQSAPCSGHPSGALTVLGSKRIHIPYRILNN
ncbi:Adp-Ribosylation Factor-Like Protein 4C [Manis pentadactyla]|nr:Adp-Ribosylation Factor-Like Protein 4C [Manis pentadactyla]